MLCKTKQIRHDLQWESRIPTWKATHSELVRMQMRNPTSSDVK